VCFAGHDLADTEVRMNRSGTAQAPIRLFSAGATVRSIHITADHVRIEGFTVASGDGVFLQGVDLAIRHNTVHDTQRSGITCAPCKDSIIESNTIRHVATTGVWISGQRITVSHNTVSETVARDNGDADGMRFFGNGHRITDNTITDISANGYANPPHPDCFQTYDNNSPPTFDVVIAGNTCRNVDAQCLIATGDQHENSAAPTGGLSIIFTGNTCASNGAQAVNLRRWPNVEIRDNKISGPHVTRGIIIIDGSTGCVVIDNTTAGGHPTVDIDGSSRPGSQVEHNSPGRGSPPFSQGNPSVKRLLQKSEEERPMGYLKQEQRPNCRLHRPGRRPGRGWQVRRASAACPYPQRVFTCTHHVHAASADAPLRCHP
jgi:Right handed beta helix region